MNGQVHTHALRCTVVHDAWRYCIGGIALTRSLQLCVLAACMQMAWADEDEGEGEGEDIAAAGGEPAPGAGGGAGAGPSWERVAVAGDVLRAVDEGLAEAAALMDTVLDLSQVR